MDKDNKLDNAVVSPADTIRRAIQTSFDPTQWVLAADREAALAALDVLLAVGKRDKAKIKELETKLKEIGKSVEKHIGREVDYESGAML